MTQEQKNEILQSAYIPEEWWNDCYISDKEQIFTPLFNEEGEMLKTGEQVYQEWLNPPVVVPKPTEMEILQGQVMDSYMAQAELYEQNLLLEERLAALETSIGGQ